METKFHPDPLQKLTVWLRPVVAFRRRSLNGKELREDSRKGNIECRENGKKRWGKAAQIVSQNILCIDTLTSDLSLYIFYIDF